MAIPVIPLVFTAALGLQNHLALEQAHSQVERVLEANTVAQTVFTLILEAESGVRGYLLTRNETHLDQYTRATRDLPPTLKRLDELVIDPAQEQRIAALRPLIDVRLAIMTRVIESSSAPDVPAALLERGNAATEQIRREVGAFRADEEALLNTFTEVAAARAQRRRTILVVGAAAGIAGGVFGGILFAAGIARRVRRLASHADRLVEGGTISVEVGGDDELGHLEQRLAESAALLSAQRDETRLAHRELDQFFSLSPEMLGVAGTDGFFKRVNPAWTQVLGWPSALLTQQPYLALVHPDDRASTEQEAAQLAQGATTVRFENRYQCSDGSYRWLQWTAVPVPEEEVIYAVARDITLQKEAAAAIAAAHDAAEKANRAKSVFLSRMSHDLRTPLNAVIGFGQLLQMDSLTKEQHESVEHVLNAGRHLLELINDVLNVARIEAGEMTLSMEPVPVAELLESAVNLVRPAASARQLSVKIRVDVDRDQHVRADRQRLMQVLLNLLSNAVKYNRAGGHLTVVCSKVSNGFVRISVADTGAGIRDEKLGLLFKPFERLGAEQSAVEGTGLGLTIVKGLTEAMGGQIGASSRVDEGSTFWVDLQETAAPAEEDKRSVAPVLAANVTEAAGTVLYIEDNDANVQLLSRILARRPQIRMLNASTGAEGIVIARSTHPDLILLDLHLPDMTGEDVLQAVWADTATRHLRIAMLTAEATPGRRRHLTASGAVAYLTKPFNVAELLQLLDEFLGRAA